MPPYASQPYGAANPTPDTSASADRRPGYPARRDHLASLASACRLTEDAYRTCVDLRPRRKDATAMVVKRCTSPEVIDSPEASAAEIFAITRNDIRVAMQQSATESARILSVLPDDHDTDAGIEVTADSAEAVNRFMIALAQTSGHELSHLTKGGYVDNCDDPDEQENAPTFHYFPCVAILADDNRQPE
ncbi:hypothetical protein [Nocardia niwae]|uniref:hypothetical protein n=1 Tax=Nocardia niwae TaxID=626084 RepID=UPI0033F8274A